MKETVISFLLEYKKKTISLGELERQAGGLISYEEFAALINELVQQGILTAVKRHGYNQKRIPLALTYRILPTKIPRNHHQEIERYHFSLHSLIKLDNYYNLAAAEWIDDLPFILKIDDFLKKQGLPSLAATGSERSYALVGDEKWIDEKGGRRLLERIGLWPAMQIISLPEPLMLAVNTCRGGEASSRHLLVENKTTFHALLDYLPDTDFFSLIYGAGWKVTADIVLLDKQLGWPEQEKKLFYFGDLDYEGISIWHALDSRRKTIPAQVFYQALLQRQPARGKENQLCNQEALQHFLSFFASNEQVQISEILANGGYYPQEGLTAAELGAIWRKHVWM